ncbi:MAG TPA: MBL fold metallo-hydrolase, partial [Verrucomicrobiae bacterium]|nr:MBL fold metallo-hydrolase [Verrucomicrobiae bacterium]
FLQSLKENLKLRCHNVFPAHGQPFDNVAERIEQLQAHHAERLGLMREATANAAAMEGATVFEVCKQVFSQELSLHEMRFAMSETYAHLMHMVYQNTMEVREKDGVLYFTTL